MKMKAAGLALVLVILVLGAEACGPAAAEEPVTSTGPSTTSTLPPATQSTAPPPTEAAADVVVFKDAVLEKGVRAALNKPTGDITFGDAASLKELRLDIPFQSPEDMMIKDISGLEHLVNLEILEMQSHAITDISPISGLTQIKGLALGGNQITDISPLAGLTKLDFLSIFNCQATDYSPLKSLSSLRVLYISWSTIADLSVLSGMTGLDDLKLDNCVQVTDVTPLAGLKLGHLMLAGTGVTDFSPLEAIYPNLVEKDFELE